MRIYVASSIENKYFEEVIFRLEELDHEVYNFKKQAFQWEDIDLKWKSWSPEQYLKALETWQAINAYRLDMYFLKSCDLCIGVMPFGISAALEVG